MSVASDIINEAYIHLAVIRPGETIDGPSMQAPALLLLQQLISSLSTEPTMAFGVYHQAFALTAGTDTYSVGTGGSLVSSQRPVQIFSWQSASGSFLKGGRVISFDELRQKAMNDTGRTSVLAEAVAADMAYAAINIQVFPKPAAGPGTLTLDYSSFIVAPASAGDTLNYPDGWDRMLAFGLAIELAPQFARQAGVPAALAANYQNSKAAIAAKNASILGLMQSAPAQQGA